MATRQIADHGQNTVATDHGGQMSVPFLDRLLLDQLGRERLLQQFLSFGLALCLGDLPFGFDLRLLQLILCLLRALLCHLLLFDGI